GRLLFANVCRMNRACARGRKTNWNSATSAASSRIARVKNPGDDIQFKCEECARRLSSGQVGSKLLHDVIGSNRKTTAPNESRDFAIESAQHDRQQNVDQRSFD